MEHTSTNNRQQLIVRSFVLFFSGIVASVSAGIRVVYRASGIHIFCLWLHNTFTSDYILIANA